MAAGEDEPQPRRRNLYGRSRGKALRAGQQRLVAEILPSLEIGPAAFPGAAAFAAERTEFWLEIGFGAGEHLVAQAKANPQVGLIGCEPFLNGVAVALAGVEREGLANVRLHRGDARALIDAAPDAFFSRVFLLYPDPWPKRRHNKRRIVSDAMVAALARVVRPGERCVSPPTSTTSPAGRSAASSRRRTFAGPWRARSIGAPTGRNGSRRAMKEKLTGRGGIPFTLLSFGYERMGAA